MPEIGAVTPTANPNQTPTASTNPHQAPPADLKPSREQSGLANRLGVDGFEALELEAELGVELEGAAVYTRPLDT